ncbi:sodium-dependent phosphate transporter [hydrocarbon metagenome]|uniref:Sodium-dependent phosphate transporter n=1 Tax=hydrocarbon metagenome TaxID=938273 RepID=A0A0W8FS56_9ZZZZ
MKEAIIVISGIILFLIGMINLSSAVRKIIDVRIKEYIRYAVQKPLYGLLTGIISTIVFQSSSASTALTVGLVSAGLISFYNSLAIILGTDIGATLTVQFVVWHFTDISPLIISVGGLLWLVRRGKWQIAGQIIFYFGLLFFGLDLISQSIEPLKDSPVFLNYFMQTQNPFLGIGLGIVVTGIIHASAIPISILALLAQQDMVSLENALPVVMGANIGTTVTALLVGTVATASGKRTAVSHLIFKCIGVVLCFILMPYLLIILRNLSSSVAQQIVLAHFVLNFVIMVTFIFLLKPFAAVMQKILKGDDETLPIWPEFLDRRNLSDEEKALDNVQKELQREINLARKMFLIATKMIFFVEEGKKRDISYIEMVVNNLRAQIVRFLWKISSQNKSTQLSKKIFAYTAIAGDIESMGNHVVWIADLAGQKAERKIRFTEMGKQELQEITSLVNQNINEAMSLIEISDKEKIVSVIQREEEIDEKVKEARNNHLKRFHNRLCNTEAGLIFVEMLIHLERISDHCNNIAEYVLDIKEKLE